VSSDRRAVEYSAKLRFLASELDVALFMLSKGLDVRGLLGELRNTFVELEKERRGKSGKSGKSDVSEGRGDAWSRVYGRFSDACSTPRPQVIVELKGDLESLAARELGGGVL